MRHLELIAAAIFTTFTAAAAPDHTAPAPLTGTYSIGAMSLTDPPPEAPTDALLRLYLTGRSARDLYAAMKVKPVKDECLADGTVTKAIGEILCAKSPKGIYECWIGIDLKSQKLAPAFVC